MEKSEIGKTGDGFIDRSKVRILLCDNDEKSCEEVFTLLCKCSYQVTSVKSPRQVIDALNADGPDIDIILSELDLPMAKGFKMLKYIMRDKELRRIPVIMMSAQDEVSIVVKCLKFGAADYLVKPLRTNELLNLWTHMWRRRRMAYPSDANTNSTTLFSDDTDDRSRKGTNLEMCVSTHHDDETNATTTAAPIENAIWASSKCKPDVPGISDRRHGTISPFTKKSELKIGESSAFFTYVKSSTPKSNKQASSSLHVNEPRHNFLENPPTESSADIREQDNQSQADDHYSSNTIHDSFSIERSYTTPSVAIDISQQRNMNSSTHSPSAHSTYPYYMPGVLSQATMQSTPMYHTNHANPTMLPQYNNIPLCPPPPHVPMMAPYPYYPFGICLQPGQMPSPNPWQSFGNSSSNEGNLNLSKVDRREAALMKFRQKRKERCFDKKIRYVNRKKLAERRPRVRGQFVRKVNGVNVDLNGQPEDDEEEEEYYDEEDQSANMDFSTEDDASFCLK
ncbi:hypothetical protein RD792_008306 [Penstemon davidsonii]|uniref:Two-component response regulator-like APRR1 n=1 Tax=Penstemon davidsonii TaxID=160366 RepID=A0ABR0DAD9_9LAMI|nr:hypothetical protein RD792_008306 [Penstemon davidsonii]